MIKKIKVLELSGYINNPNKLVGSTLKAYEELFVNIYNNKAKFGNAVIDSWINEDNQFAGIILDLTKIDKNLIKEFKIDSIIETYPIQHCSVCGCYYFTHVLHTYRNNSGCVGSSCECLDCRMLNNEATEEIRETREENGEIEAKKYSIKMLNE